MPALSSKARAVIEQADEEVRPPAGEMERLEALLMAQIGASAGSFVQSASPRLLRAPHSASWRLVGSLTVGAVLAGGAALWSLRSTGEQAPPAPRITAPPQVVPAAEKDSTPALEAPAPHAAQPAPVAVKQSFEPKQPAQDALAQEVALLSRATRDLRAGSAGAALKLLDEHQRKFPNGMLAVERRAVRAQALCTLKRVSEGRAEIAQLAPQSPAAGRAKQLCDAAAGAR